MTLCIVSTARPGAERGALLGANNCGLETGGWAERTLKKDSLFRKHVGKDVRESLYFPRQNSEYCRDRCLQASDGVLMLCKKKRARLINKPLLQFRYSIWSATSETLVKRSKTLAKFIKNHEIEILYVTGDSEDYSMRIEGWTYTLMIMTSHELRRAEGKEK